MCSPYSLLMCLYEAMLTWPGIPWLNYGLCAFSRLLALLVYVFVVWQETILNFELFFKFSKNLNLCQTSEKSGFWTKFSKNSDFRQNWGKFKFVKIFDTSQFYSKHLDFGPNFQKSWFWSKLLKKSWLKSKFSIYLDFSQKNGDFGQNLWKSWSWSKFKKNLEFGQIFEKISIDVKHSKIQILVKIYGKIAILVKIFEILDFGKDFWNTSTLVKILILDKSFEK